MMILEACLMASVSSSSEMVFYGIPSLMDHKISLKQHPQNVSTYQRYLNNSYITCQLYGSNKSFTVRAEIFPHNILCYQ